MERGASFESSGFDYLIVVELSDSSCEIELELLDLLLKIKVICPLDSSEICSHFIHLLE